MDISDKIWNHFLWYEPNSYVQQGLFYDNEQNHTHHTSTVYMLSVCIEYVDIAEQNARKNDHFWSMSSDIF